MKEYKNSIYNFIFIFRNIQNILIFNVTALRDYCTFLKIILTENKIDLVLICPIITSIDNRRPGNKPNYLQS